jgi:hypothetical protein
MLCAKNDNLQCANHLLNPPENLQKAKVNAKDGDGNTALHCAIIMGNNNKASNYSEMAKLLVRSGARVTIKNNPGKGEQVNFLSFA